MCDLFHRKKQPQRLTEKEREDYPSGDSGGWG